MDRKIRFSVWLLLFVSAVAVVVAGLSAGGCARSISMAPEAAMEFNRFNASVQEWEWRCQADPNTCAKSLSTMAEELQSWTDIVNGADPNRGI